MTDSAARRVRRADLRATKLTLSFRGGGARDATGRRRDDRHWSWEGAFAPARDDHTFMTALAAGLAEAERHLPFRPRSVSVMIHGLIGATEVMDDLVRLGEEARGRLRHAVLNHLTPVLGYAQVLERESLEDDEARRRLASIVRHALAIREALDPARRSGR